MYTIRQIAEKTGSTKQRVRRLIKEQGIRTIKVGSDNEELKKAGFKTGMIVVADAEAEKLIDELKKDSPESHPSVPQNESDGNHAISADEPSSESEEEEGPEEVAAEVNEDPAGSEDEKSFSSETILLGENASFQDNHWRIYNSASSEKRSGYSAHSPQTDELSDPVSALIREKNERIRQLQEDLELERQRAEEERHRYDVLMTVINRQSLDIQRMIALGVSGSEVEGLVFSDSVDPGETDEAAADKPLSQEDEKSVPAEEPAAESKSRSGPGKFLQTITKRREKHSSADVSPLSENIRDDEICEDCDPSDVAEETAFLEEEAVQKYDDGGIQLELKAVAGKKETLGATVVPLYPDLVIDPEQEFEEIQKKSFLRRFLEVFGIMDS